jgi:hypothetical protein
MGVVMAIIRIDTKNSTQRIIYRNNIPDIIKKFLDIKTGVVIRMTQDEYNFFDEACTHYNMRVRPYMKYNKHIVKKIHEIMINEINKSTKNDNLISVCCIVGDVSYKNIYDRLAVLSYNDEKDILKCENS